MPAPFGLEIVTHQISSGRATSKNSVDALKDRRSKRHSIVAELDGEQSGCSSDYSDGRDVRGSSDWQREVSSTLLALSKKLDDVSNRVMTCQSGILDIKVDTRRLQIYSSAEPTRSPKGRKPTFLRGQFGRSRDGNPSPVSAGRPLSPTSACRALEIAGREPTQSELSDVSWRSLSGLSPRSPKSPMSPKPRGRSNVPDTVSTPGAGHEQAWDSLQGDHGREAHSSASALAKSSGPFLRIGSPSLPTLQNLHDEQPVHLKAKEMPDSIQVEGQTAELEEESLPREEQNVKIYVRQGSTHSHSRQVSCGTDGSTGRDERFSIERLQRARTRSRVEKKLWTVLEDPEEISGGTFVTRLLSVAITTMAFFPFFEILDPPPIDLTVLGIVQNVFDCVFMLEVLLRFYSCPNRFAFFLLPYNLVDLVAGLVPFVVSMIIGSSGGLLQEAESNGSSRLIVWLVCSIPILRLLKLLRRFQSFHLLYAAFRQAFEALPVLLYTLTILVLSFASLIYILEPKGSMPMPQVLWMTVVTIGTVGYGDVVPQTAEGKVLVSLLIIVSSLYMAIPIGIVGKTFGDIWDDRTKILMLHRTRAKFTTTGYTARDIPSMFCSFDKDGDGELTLQEFMAMMRTLEIVVDDGRVVELFNSFDYNSDGTIDDEEFVRAMFPSAYLQIYGGNLEEYANRSEEDEMSQVI